MSPAEPSSLPAPAPSMLRPIHLQSAPSAEPEPDRTVLPPLSAPSSAPAPAAALPLYAASSDLAHPATDGFNPNAPVFTPAAEVLSLPADHAALDGAPSASPEIDPQILEALRSKDRIYVLKLGEQMESLIAERRFRIDLAPSTSYQRLLVHRCSAYYRLLPEGDPVSKGIFVSTTPESRIPPRRLADLVPAEASAHPTFQIMRRSSQNRRYKPHSQAGSVAGDDGDYSDIEASEAGSVGGRSNAGSKKRMTIEQREAAYNEARSRIFEGFEAKEKEKEKDMSSSSSLSVVSGSASTSGSVGDIDDSASSVATESEWSAPSFKKGRSSTSTRSIRSSAPSFSSNGAGSSRNSRAPSPSFSYPTLYEPNVPVPSYDAPVPNMPVTASGYHQPPHFYYPYGPGQPPHPAGYLAPYPPPFYGYYAPPPPPPPPPQANSSDPSPPANGEMYAPHPVYHSAYSWPPANQQPPLPNPIPPTSPSENGNGHQPQNQNSPPYPPQGYGPPSPMYMYPMHGYYPPAPPPAQSMMHGLPPPLPQPHLGQLYDPRNSEPPLDGAEHSNNSAGRGGYSATRGQPRGAPFAGNGKGGRGAAPQARHAWSYGPGISNGGFNAGDIGPRFNNNRRQSNHSSGSSSGNYRSSSNWDEVSSTASSSTTSSSSRRTYTSSSSQHPLPARPDWAVGLKPDPTLHSTSRHPESRSPISPTRNGNSSSRRTSSNPSLQSNDFPPLSTVPLPEKRVPTVTGAWTNPSATRSLMTASGQGSALVNHSNVNRLEDADRFERPPPRAAELYNPKLAKRSSSNNSAKHQEKDDRRVRDSVGMILAEQVRGLSIESPLPLDGPGQHYQEPAVLQT